MQPFISRAQMATALLLLLLLAACDGFNAGQFLPGNGGDPALTAEPGSTTAIVDNPTATPSPAVVETPILMCTPPACGPGETTSCPTDDCPGGCGTVCATAPPASGPLPPAPADWEGLESWLASMWQANVNPAAVRAALQQAGLQKSLDDWRAADFDGDLQDEWAVVLYDRSMPEAGFGSAGDLWVVNGSGAIFRYYTAPSNDIFEFLAPRIVALIDMTGDGRPELIANASVCGAHTCFDNYRIIGSAGGGLTDLQSVQPPPEVISGPPTISMSYSNVRFNDVDFDGLPEMLVHGGTIGSAGAGIVRPRTEVWDWDGSAVTLDGTLLDPTTYRHHILYEANDLMAAGDLDAALALYEATINDPALRNDGFAPPPQQTYADISAFAAFRLILIDLLQGNAERAGGRLAWLGATYPDSAAAGAAATLVNGWSGPENLAALCDGIEAGLLAVENPAGALADMGYGNPSLGAGDFCPVVGND